MIIVVLVIVTQVMETVRNATQVFNPMELFVHHVQRQLFLMEVHVLLAILLAALAILPQDNALNAHLVFRQSMLLASLVP